MLNQRPSQPFYPNEQPFLAKTSQLMISSQHVTVSSQETIISKCMKPMNNSKQPTSNSQEPTGNGTQPISNFEQHKSYSLGPKSNSIGNITANWAKKFAANFTKKNLAASQKIFFLPLVKDAVRLSCPSKPCHCRLIWNIFQEHVKIILETVNVLSI